MSKKSARQNVYYNRQSKGWQQNQMKKQMTEAGYAKGLPKPLDGKKMRIVVIAGAVVLLALTVLLIIKLHWTGFFIGLGLIIVELKSPKLKDGKEQLKSYCNGTGAPIGVWTNGESISYYHRKDPNFFEDIPTIPNANEKLSDILSER